MRKKEPKLFEEKYMKGIISLIIVGLIFAVLLSMVSCVQIQGNEVGVKETWGEGVISQPMFPKTYILFPAFMQTVYKYKTSSQVFVMNDKKNSEEFGNGRKLDSYQVQSSEGQDMRISLNLVWRIDLEKVIELHKNTRTDLEERLIRPLVMRVVKDEATKRKAIDAYSGEGLVSLQNDIRNNLMCNEEIRKRGVIIENFLIEEIALDPRYTEQIKARQVAIQSKLRADEEAKAALAKAEQTKAEAQGDYEKTLVEARRDKEVGILKAEKEAQQVRLQAEASASQATIAAKAEQEASLMRASAIKAIGEAEAYAVQQKMSAYSGSGSLVYAQMEVAKSMAEAFKNIDGYLPSDMKVNILSESFMQSVKGLVGGAK